MTLGLIKPPDRAEINAAVFSPIETMFDDSLDYPRAVLHSDPDIGIWAAVVSGASALGTNGYAAFRQYRGGINVLPSER